MRKILLLAVLATYLLSVDFLIGFGYGSFEAKTEYQNTKYGSTKTKDMHYKAGLDFKNHRVLITQDAPDMIAGEEITVNSLSWHAIDQTDPFIRGFFGLGYADFAYKNEVENIDESKNAYGVEFGFMLLEKGHWVYEHMEMEFGYRYFTTKGLSQDEKFKLDNFSSMYVGFNFLF